MANRILIIDDEEWIATLLQDYLVEHGFEVNTAPNIKLGREQLLQPVLPDLVVLDVMLPDGNGVEFLAEIRATPRTKTLPVIIISAHRIQVQDRIIGFDTGADDYLVKPFDLKEFISRIERLLKRVKTTQQMPTSPRSTVPASEYPSPKATTLKDIFRHPMAHQVNRPSMVPQESSLVDSLEPMWKRIVQLILAPAEFLKNWKDRLNLQMALTLAASFSVGLGLQKGLQDKSVAVGVVSVLGLSAASVGIWVGVAWIIHLVLGLKQKIVSFKKLVLAFAVWFGPAALAAVLGVLYVGIGSGQWGDFTVGPLLIVPMQASSAIFGFAFRRMDFFELWGLWLVVQFLIGICGFKKPNVFRWVFGSWIIMVIAVSLIKGAF